MKKYLQYLPGLILTILIGLTAKKLNELIPNMGSVTFAIILGIIVGNLFKPDKSYKYGIKFSEKKILSVAIMLMGLQLDLKILKTMGFKTIIFIILMVFLSVVSGYFIGRLSGLKSSFSLLIGIGNGISGSSAIAATAPLLKADEEETGLSISVINFLGTLGIFLLPFLLKVFLPFNELKSGLMIGGTLQAVGQVTAAGFSLSDGIGKISTIVKMGRILMLGPFLLLLGLILKGKSSSHKEKVGSPIPGFIIGFFVFSLIASMGIIPSGVHKFLKFLSKELLIIAMAGIGLKIQFVSLINQGPKALLVGILNFVIQIIGGVLLILLLFNLG